MDITVSNDWKNNVESLHQVKDYEKQIDQLVYDLYGLTKQEISLVDNL